MNKILRVFLDVDMRNQHDGLSTLATKNKVNLSNLDPGCHVIFINSKQNKIKVFSCRGTLTYIRKDKGRIDLNFISMIPQAFNDFGELEWAKAEKLSLEKRLKS